MAFLWWKRKELQLLQQVFLLPITPARLHPHCKEVPQTAEAGQVVIDIEFDTNEMHA